MKVLGIRCSNTDFAYAILEGRMKNPALLKAKTISYPKNFSRSRSLKWLLTETEEVIKRNDIRGIFVRRSEAMRCSNAQEARVEHEAAVFIAAENCGIKNVTKKVKSTIAKDLGLKGKSKYLSKLNTSLIPEFDNCNSKEKDAILVGWSGLY